VCSARYQASAKSPRLGTDTRHTRRVVESCRSHDCFVWVGHVFEGEPPSFNGGFHLAWTTHASPRLRFLCDELDTDAVIASRELSALRGCDGPPVVAGVGEGFVDDTRVELISPRVSPYSFKNDRGETGRVSRSARWVSSRSSSQPPASPVGLVFGG
jgi:hypothetical protein